MWGMRAAGLPYKSFFKYENCSEKPFERQQILLIRVKSEEEISNHFWVKPPFLFLFLFRIRLLDFLVFCTYKKLSSISPQEVFLSSQVSSLSLALYIWEKRMYFYHPIYGKRNGGETNTFPWSDWPRDGSVQYRGNIHIPNKIRISGYKYKYKFLIILLAQFNWILCWKVKERESQHCNNSFRMQRHCIAHD